MAKLRFLDITKVIPREVKSAKSGRTFRIAELQGLMHYDDGETDVFVLDVFDSEAMPIDKLERGKFVPVLEMFPARDSRKLEARIVGLHPVAAAVSKAAA